jgi:hypothetical protein
MEQGSDEKLGLTHSLNWVKKELQKVGWIQNLKIELQIHKK